MSSIAEVTLDQIDDWFVVGKKPSAPVKSVPKSKTGGRIFDGKTGEARVAKAPGYAVLYPDKRTAYINQRDYAKVYQEEEEQNLLRHTMPTRQENVESVTGIMEQLELDSTIAGSVSGSVAMPDDLIPANATDVYRNYQFTQQTKIDLPISNHRDEIIATIESNQVTVIQGSTGSGKTTQVPQYLLDHYAKENRYCNIVVTQPRRIAAMSIAKRVCNERSWALGTVCGYQVGLDRKASEDTRILYCTTGVLREKIVGEKSMAQFTHVILDEIHERDQESDFALLMVRKLLRTNSRNVKVVLMSATLDSKQFAEYFALPIRDRLEPAPVINVEGRVFRVSEFYANDLSPALGPLPDLDDRKACLTDEALDMAVKLIQELDVLEIKELGKDNLTGFAPVRGSVLVFLPGYGEITDVFDKLCPFESKHCLKIIPLHSSITSEEQNRVFEPPHKGYRKIILSTNIAESSITVTDIKYVIDFCLTKNLVCDQDTNYTHLQMEWASKSNCTQRKGRAGRVSNGRAYFMVTQKFFEDFLPDHGVPEMQRCPLESLVLKTKIFDMGEPKALLGLALSPPRLDEIERTVLNLKEAGALATGVHGITSKHDGDLTYIGRVLADLPLDIRIGKLLVLGHVFGLLEECIIIGAALSLKSIFAKPFKAKLEAYKHKQGWSDSSLSDCLAILNAYKVWDEKRKMHEFKRAGQGERKWGELNFIQIRRMNEVSELVKEIEQRLQRFSIEKSRQRPNFKKDIKDPQERLLLKIVIAGAFYPNYFMKTESDETEAIKQLSNNDAMNTVMVKGLPANQGMLYRETLETMFRKCYATETPVISFEETKAFISFPWKNNTTYDHKVHQGVYTAIKLRYLRIPLEIEVYSREDASQLMNQLQKAKDSAIESGRLRTNRVMATETTMGEQVVTESMVVPAPGPESPFSIICVTEVVECGHFWSQYVNAERFQELKFIQDNLNYNQGSRLSPLSGQLRLGTYCAAAFKENDSVAFYRGRIEGITNDSDPRTQKVHVFFVDYGNSEWTPRSSLRALPDDFASIPFQAVECFLSGIRPSTVKCPDGVWSREANSKFRDKVLGKNLFIQIYSVVRDTIRVELLEKQQNGLEYSINQDLIRRGFADHAEEPFLSKQSHDQRELESITLASNTTLDKDIAAKQGFLSVHLAPDKVVRKRGKKMKLVGPTSPLEISFYSMTALGRLRIARIDQDSVNSVAIDDEPQNKQGRMMVASFVGLNPTGQSMIARDTTIMPLINGLPSLLTLLFTPVAEFRTDRKRERYIGAICGLGFDPHTGQAILPDHDIELTFDTKIDDEDIVKINGIRMAINIAIGSQNTVAGWGPDAVYKLQKRARENLIQLIQRRREPIEPCNYNRAFSWNMVDPFYVLDHALPLDEDYSMLNPHCAIALVEEESRKSDELKKHVEKLHEFSKSHRRESMKCLLCNVVCQTPQLLALHLQTRNHTDKEHTLFSMYSN
ncbi:ATP-dependent RNA helicase TDRD9 [Patella vulgata]|uniref:ATP-dependent RNA helicase TDRD9 n=1 Tax=Patella vulgata TaxID=6465 RepID=UPI0024A8ECB7|nr:ATP-dependent RNA helicase TDRD9 [Patella vulgata]